MARGVAYSPEEVERGLEALAESGGNASAASRVTGIPRTTLIGWKKEHFDEFDDLRQEKRGDFIKEVWDAAREALRYLREKLPDMKPKDLAITLGILVDKGLVLGGEPSQITKTEGADGTSRLLAAIERELAQAESETETDDLP